MGSSRTPDPRYSLIGWAPTSQTNKIHSWNISSLIMPAFSGVTCFRVRIVSVGSYYDQFHCFHWFHDFYQLHYFHNFSHILERTHFPSVLDIFLCFSFHKLLWLTSPCLSYQVSELVVYCGNMLTQRSLSTLKFYQMISWGLTDQFSADFHVDFSADFHVDSMLTINYQILPDDQLRLNISTFQLICSDVFLLFSLCISTATIRTKIG